MTKFIILGLIITLIVILYSRFHNAFTLQRRSTIAQFAEKDDIDSIINLCTNFYKTIKIPETLRSNSNDQIATFIYKTLSKFPTKEIEPKLVKILPNKNVIFLGLIKLERATNLPYQMSVDYNLENNVVFLFKIDIDKHEINIYIEKTDYTLEIKNMWDDLIEYIKLRILTVDEYNKRIIEAKEIGLTVVISSNQKVNIPFLLKYQFDYKPSDINGPLIEDLDIISGPILETVSNVRIIDGKTQMITKYFYTFQLVAKNPGEYLIPNAIITVNGKKYSTQLSKINVTN